MFHLHVSLEILTNRKIRIELIDVASPSKRFYSVY